MISYYNFVVHFGKDNFSSSVLGIKPETHNLDKQNAVEAIDKPQCELITEPSIFGSVQVYPPGK